MLWNWMNFSTFHQVVPSGKRWQRKWGSPEINIQYVGETNNEFYLQDKRGCSWSLRSCPHAERAAGSLSFSSQSCWIGSKRITVWKQTPVGCKRFLFVIFVDNLRQQFYICIEIHHAAVCYSTGTARDFTLTRGGGSVLSNYFSFVHLFWEGCEQI